MEKVVSFKRLYLTVLLVCLLPLVLFLLNDFPERELLKNSLSILTLVVFFAMIVQFYLSRGIRAFAWGVKISDVIKLHKILGYSLAGILVLHPFFIVLPRFFEAGITPSEALISNFTDFHGTGMVAGITAYIVLIVLVLTSYFRNNLGMKYTTWRVLHGILSIVFIVLAAFHVVKTGRHMSTSFIFLMMFFLTGGVLLSLRIYYNKKSN